MTMENKTMGSSPPAPELQPGVAERRRFPRYRLSAPITVRSKGLPEMRGMSIDISEGGMSAAVGVGLKVGDAVELEPVGGAAAAAVVRRILGRLCGFEFLNLSPEQAEKVREMSGMFPLYRPRTLDLWKR
jgi:c-di-GMP-binding flagellar brake protein YcgR